MAEILDTGRRVGRPFKFTDPTELKAQIKSYFDNRDPHIEKQKVESGTNARGETIWDFREVMTKQQPYTISSLAVYLGTSRQTLLDYCSPSHYPEDMPDETVAELIDTILEAKDRCEAYNEDYMYSGKPTRGVEFVLRNGYGYVDLKKVEQTNHDAKEALDDVDTTSEVDQGKDEMADAAAAELAKTEGNQENATDGSNSTDSIGEQPGSEAQVEVVADDPPVQDQG